ncbi:MAG TPA: hypothetical protein VJ692_16200 [Nitrospiraceae bacterium]|nr:hypothetical protein [Nitrospiraceae bacterium]
MREEIVNLITAGRKVIALLGAGTPLSQKDYAALTSLTWNLIAALHARKGPDTHGEKSAPADPTEPSDHK